MTFRVAKFADIPEIVDLMRDSHERSRYADRTTFDEVDAKQMLVRSMQRQDHKTYMGSMVLVSENSDGVNGFMLGIFDLVYPCLKELRATDLFFLMDTARADPRDAITMITHVKAWAYSNPKCIELVLGVTDAMGHWAKAGNLYEMCGLRQCGAMYRIEFDRSQEVAA